MTPRAPDGRSAPGVDSRSASIGSTLVARRAGTSAATTVTTVPTSRRQPDGARLDLQRRDGQREADDVHEHFSPFATPTPSPKPTAEAPAPSTSASSSRLREHLAAAWRRWPAAARSRASAG